MISPKTIKKLKALKAERVFVQFPEGLKPRIQKIAKQLEREGFEVFLFMEPVFGACDIRDWEAGVLGCDAILHIGHSDMALQSELPVVFDEYRIKIDINRLEKELKKIKYRKIGLLTTLQFIDSLDEVERILKAEGREVYTGKPKKARYPGQVLGCDYSAALSVEKEVDCFLFFGSGRFHPLGLLLKTEKPVLFLDIERGRMTDLDGERDKLRIKKGLLVEKARGCKNFGILVSVKKGQLALKKAEKLKRVLEGKGKKAYILVFDRITPEKLLGLEIDCLVNTACPRLSEDQKMFRKPILDAGDAGEL
jgi:2-(3-amino-3-carboxypropyl)histidine synthase